MSNDDACDLAYEMKTLFREKFEDYFYTTEKVGISLRFLFSGNLKHFFLKKIEFDHVFEFFSSLIIMAPRTVYFNEYHSKRNENHFNPDSYEKYKINSVEKKENLMKSHTFQICCAP